MPRIGEMDQTIDNIQVGEMNKISSTIPDTIKEIINVSAFNQQRKITCVRVVQLTEGKLSSVYV